jgi:hypothetical protein
MTNIHAEIVVHSLYDFCLCVIMKHAGRACSCNALEISHLRMRTFEENFRFLMTGAWNQDIGFLTKILGIVLCSQRASQWAMWFHSVSCLAYVSFTLKMPVQFRCLANRPCTIWSWKAATGVVLDMSGTYCDMITFPIVRHWLSKHVSVETDTHATMEELWEAVFFYMVGAKTI